MRPPSSAPVRHTDYSFLTLYKPPRSKPPKPKSSLSKDEDTQVGALILDVNGKVGSMGYNGCPAKFGVYRNTDDSVVPHTRKNREIKLINNFTSL